MKTARTNKKVNERGVSIVEILIVIVIVTAAVGFAFVNLVQGRRAVVRTKTATDFANYLQKARIDSMRRKPTDINQMAQIKVFNRKFYSVAIDADGDGNLDAPLVLTVPAEQDVAITGPFPKTYIFDARGMTVDSINHPVVPQPITVSNGAGASAITFSENGNITVVAALKPRK